MLAYNDRETGVNANVHIDVPLLDRLEQVTLDAETLDMQCIVGFDGNDISSRPFNLLRSQIMKKMRRDGNKLLGITSAAPGTGKSFIAANLAAALSQLGDTKVYLFDLDLRRASLAERFGLSGDVGLTQYLDGTTSGIANVGRRVAGSDLGIFPCYPSSVNSAELLAGPRIDALIAGMRELPEDAIAICDLPPAFANDDALAIVQKLDTYLLIVEEGVTTKKQLGEVRAFLDPAPCIGTVLNRYKGGWGDSYSYGDRSKYSKYYASN